MAERLDLEAIRERVTRTPFIEMRQIAMLDAQALVREVDRLRAENARWREWWFAQGHRGYPPPEDLLREALKPPPHTFLGEGLAVHGSVR